MNKLFKKFTATVIAAVITSSALALCANAASEEKTFYTRHVNSPTYVPSEVNYPAVVRMTASAEKYTGVVTDMTNLVNRSVTITSTTHTIFNISTNVLEFNNTNKPISWEIALNSSRNVVYKVKAHTDQYGALEVYGSISR